MRPLSHNAEASDSTCKSGSSEAIGSDGSSMPDGFQLCVCELGEGRQQKSANREQASTVRVMDSLPYLNVHKFIDTLWSTF